jgi:hypothetical protein
LNTIYRGGDLKGAYSTTFTLGIEAGTGSAVTPLALTSALPANTILVTDKIFASTSHWYTPIPIVTDIHPNSADFVAEFLRQKKKYYGTVTVNTVEYSSPVYTVGPDVKPITMGFFNCQNKTGTPPTFMKMISDVPIPDYAIRAQGTDGEMTIYQPSTDTLWELWKADKDANNNWVACWGGKMTNASKNSGVFDGTYGTTATSLPFLGGQITADELRRGEIKHAIGISLVNAAARIFSFPAHRTDGVNAEKVAFPIAEGQRFRLDPSINVDILPMSKAGKIIAKAAQKYGFIVWDHAGAIGIRAEGVNSYMYNGSPNPYPALFGTPNYAVLSGFPWEKLQFMPFDFGKP